MSFKKINRADSATLRNPEASVAFFEKFKRISEQYWETEIAEAGVYGFQIQQNSKWRKGLNDAEILQFETDMGFAFPEPLKNFYKTMNGLDRPGVNVYGDENEFCPVFYSYPDDLGLIREMIDWVYKGNSINDDGISNAGISRLFPIFQHRFMLVDIPDNPILSMWGNDIIYWAHDISRLLVIDVFSQRSDAGDLRQPISKIIFWLD